MNQKLNINAAGERKKVILHLQQADYLLIFLPMLLTVILSVVPPVIWLIDDELNGNRTEAGEFDFSGIIITVRVFVCSILILVYAILALILSLLTRRNITFRILLVAISFLSASIFCVWFFN